MTNTKISRLNDLLSIGLYISHANMDKSKDEIEEIQSLGKHIALLENQVKHYKTSQGMVINFIEEVLEEGKTNVQIKNEFIYKVFNIHELSMKLFKLYNENLVWKEQ
jgi:hypothetical protein